MIKLQNQDKWWPWYILIIFILIALLSQSCVSQRVPGNEPKASRKIEKHLNGIKKITTQYPDLVDSVRSDIEVPIELEQDTLDGFTPTVDSTGVNAAFDEYERKLARRDSLNKVLQSGLLNMEDSLHALRLSDEAEAAVQSGRFEVVKEVFNDTTVVDNLTMPLLVGLDTLDLQLEITTEIKEGVPATSVVVKGIQGSTKVEQTSPLFTVYKKIPWWGYLMLFALGMLLLHRIFKTR